MTTSAPTAAPAQHRKRHLWLKFGLPLLLLVLLVPVVWVASTLGFTYSSGERTGYVQKLSHRGWLCKTWEGELAMSPVPGSPPQMFDFSIRGDSLAHALEGASGKQVELFYAQHVGVPTSCFGETQYYIQSFKALN